MLPTARTGDVGLGLATVVGLVIGFLIVNLILVALSLRTSLRIAGLFLTGRCVSSKHGEYLWNDTMIREDTYAEVQN